MAPESQPEHLPPSAPAAPADAEDNGNAGFNEDSVLAQLANRDLTPEDLERIALDADVMKSRKVRLAVASHPRTSRRIALRLIRELYTFELVKYARMPKAAADLRRVADDLLLTRLPSITLGERISLGRRCSELVASALLSDKEEPVWRAALQNPRLTENGVVKALQRSGATPAFVDAVSHHQKWSVRPEIRVALLRNAHTPLARAIEFARSQSPAHLRDILHTSRLPERIRNYLQQVHRSDG